MRYRLQEIDRHKSWEIQSDNPRHAVGYLERIAPDRFRLRRYQIGEVETPAADIASKIITFFPEGSEFVVVNLDGSSRPMKAELVTTKVKHRVALQTVHVHGYGTFTFSSRDDLRKQMMARIVPAAVQGDTLEMLSKIRVQS